MEYQEALYHFISMILFIIKRSYCKVKLTQKENIVHCYICVRGVQHFDITGS